jgi:YHS domain-containing protein
MKSLNTLVLFLLIGHSLFSQTEAQRKKHFNTKQAIAIQGYDPVSYFDNRPAEGKESLKYTFKGVTYQFVSETNLNKFKASPEKYEPAYGGWCAYAMGATGEKVKIDPETFKINDGKLYLFYNFWANNTLKDWNKNEKTLRDKADKHWAKTLE